MGMVVWTCMPPLQTPSMFYCAVMGDGDGGSGPSHEGLGSKSTPLTGLSVAPLGAVNGGLRARERSALRVAVSTACGVTQVPL